ncbi:MAG TPA: Maf family protein [Methylophilaceae bacterium]|nr:Maf family protein [Methylophilaceae bacterium]
MSQKIYLASRSPRRAELLQQIGIEHVILPSDVDESLLANEHPHDYVLRLARTKAEACFADLKQAGLPLMPILAADTTVSVGDLILGKPEHDEEAREMLKRMSGGWHEVHTGIAVASAQGVETALSTTRVQMAELSDAAITAYIASGEPRDKAGAYGIQGLAGIFIKRIEGSYSGVMGLPIFETAQLLNNAGIRVL